MRPRYALARRRAQQLLKDGNVTAAPVPLERLAALCRAVIRYQPFEGELSGMVHRRPDGTAVIGVNSTHTATRQRFTIAHEIAHLLLHGDEDFHIDEKMPLGRRDHMSSRASDPREIEANQFAAELVMPEFIVRSVVKTLFERQRQTSVDKSIDQLARRFRVSSVAMTHRLTNLGIIASVDEVAG